jgi:DNA invertase Pin-like site-specific DNA recombinase
MERPALKKLLADVEPERLDVIAVYNVDRRNRSPADFAKLVELFDAHDASFVSVTHVCVLDREDENFNAWSAEPHER